MSDLDLNEVRTFIKVIEAGSFTKASVILNQPKSRVSRRIASLEKDLGIQLIYRTTRQLQLTDAGRAFFEKCRPLVIDLESVASTVDEYSQEVSGLIRLTAPADMANVLLPSILSEFNQLYPKVRFQLVLAQEILDLVKESIDVAFRISHLKDSSMKARKISDVRSIIVASPSLLEKYSEINRLDDINDLPTLDFQVRKPGVWRVHNGKENVDFKIKPTFICNNPIFVHQMAVMGKGVALLPEFLCVESIRRGELVHLLKTYRGENAPFWVVMPAQKESSLRIQRFVDFAARKLKGTL